MPQYDYRCDRCRKAFTVSLSITEYEKRARGHKIKCPKCGSTAVRHVIESVFVTTSRKS